MPECRTVWHRVSLVPEWKQYLVVYEFRTVRHRVSPAPEWKQFFGNIRMPECPASGQSSTRMKTIFSSIRIPEYPASGQPNTRMKTIFGSTKGWKWNVRFQNLLSQHTIEVLSWVEWLPFPSQTVDLNLNYIPTSDTNVSGFVAIPQLKRRWNKIIKKTKLLMLSVELAPTHNLPPPSQSAKLGKASTWHTRKRKTKREGREIWEDIAWCRVY